MKLTEDDTYAISQALRHCYKQDAYIFTLNGEESEETVNFNDLYKRFDEKQILSHQEIVEYVKEFAENPFNPSTFLINLWKLLGTKDNTLTDQLKIKEEQLKKELSPSQRIILQSKYDSLKELLANGAN